MRGFSAAYEQQFEICNCLLDSQEIGFKGNIGYEICASDYCLLYIWMGE